MNFKNLIVVLPSHTLEDFPVHETCSVANSLLANWTAIWHPSLIGRSDVFPSWVSKDFVDKDLANSLILVPEDCCGSLADSIVQAGESNGSVLIAGCVSRSQIISHPDFAPHIDENLSTELVGDFFGLAYAFLQIQLMTRQLRFSTSIDMDEFQRRTLEAAKTVSSGSVSRSKEKIASCFDLLLEERNSYYPTDPQLIDLCLVPPIENFSTREFKNQLGRSHATNFLIESSVLESVQTCAASQKINFKECFDSNQHETVLGGSFEPPVQLSSIETLLRKIKNGIDDCNVQLGVSPKAFGSCSFGLNTQIPNILEQCGIDIAIHNSFVGGVVPTGSSSVINWQGHDGTNIAALATMPLNASLPEGFLRMGVNIGEMLDSFHHAEILLAHWPNQYCDWFEDFLVSSKYGNLFGNFTTLTKVRESIYDTGFSDSFEAEDYEFPHLEMATKNRSVNPISRWAEFWRLLYRIRTIQNLLAMSAVANNNNFSIESIESNITEWQRQLSQPNWAEQSASIESGLKSCLVIFGVSECYDVVDSNSYVGKLVNASCAMKRSSQFDLTPFSFSDFPEKGKVRRRDPEVIFDCKKTGLPALRNEFFEIRFDKNTGGILSASRHEKKGNLFSQQLSIRHSSQSDQYGHRRYHSQYLTCNIDGFRAERRDNSIGSVISSGALLDSHGNPWARFNQKTTVERFSRRIAFRIDVEIIRKLIGDPWRNYFASRLAWADEDSEIFKSENEIKERVYKEKIVAPNFVEIRSKLSKIALLPGGLPFHRRSSRRFLDTLMVVDGEDQTSFEFAIEIDPVTSMSAATDYLTPTYLTEANSPMALNAGWFFHFNCQNIVVTNVQPIQTENGVNIGVCFRLQETEGRSGELSVCCPYPLNAAFRTNFLNEKKHDVEFVDNRANCSFMEFQFFQLELRW